MTVKRGDIYYADLSPVVGSEQGGVRPVLIVQNDVGNRFSPTVIAAAITSQKDKTNLPTHIEVDAGHCGLSKDSIVLLEQVRTIDKRRLREKMGALDVGDMGKVNEALSVVDRYLDDAYFSGLSEVNIIHGKGTGALRTGVQDFLKRHPRVKGFRIGNYGEGDAGVTVVTLKK